MTRSPLDRAMWSLVVAAGLLLLLAGAGWAYWGADIFLSTLMAGLAYCF
jgi:hypothetical protein